MKGEMVRIQNMQSALKKIEMMELYMQIEHTYKTEYLILFKKLKLKKKDESREKAKRVEKE